MFDGDGAVGSVIVHTTQNRGSTPEEIADRALNRILHIAESTHPVLREQAQAFRDQLKVALVYYLHEAVRANKDTLAIKLREAGLENVVPILDV